jgi:hypothetical protein
MSLFSRINNARNEEGSLPAIMGAAILISATAVLLGAFAIATTRNSEVSISKTSLNAAVSNCETTLSSSVQKTFYQDVNSGKSNLLDMGVGDTTATTNLSLKNQAEKYCNYDAIKTTVRVTAAQQYVPSDSTTPNSIKVTFKAEYKGANTTTVTQVRYLKYPVLASAQKVAADSFISSYDAEGNAVWVNLSE